MTLYNNFLLKRGVGLFSRVGLISGDYGSAKSVTKWKCRQWYDHQGVSHSSTPSGLPDVDRVRCPSAVGARVLGDRETTV